MVGSAFDVGEHHHKGKEGSEGNHGGSRGSSVVGCVYKAGQSP